MARIKRALGARQTGLHWLAEKPLSWPDTAQWFLGNRTVVFHAD
jgi:hypothetical protein